MSTPEAIPFDENLRGSGDSAGVRNIAEVIETQGIDAASDLYDEAIGLAREGHLGKARDRLRMLLCLDPSDGQAHLLLAKVFGAGGRWADAIAELDAAVDCGTRIPRGLREGFELKRDERRQDASRADKVVARTEGELRGLRDEARRLRSDNARLEDEVKALGDTARKWMLVTTVVALFSALVLLVVLVSGGDPEPTPDVTPSADVSAPFNAPPFNAPAAVTRDVPSELGAAAPMASPDAIPPSTSSSLMHPSGVTHTVQDGENLTSISMQHYGTILRWEDIRDVNQDLLGGSVALQPGMVLQLPQ